MLFPQLAPQYYDERDRGILSRMEAMYAESISINQSFWSEADTDTRFWSGDQTLWNDLYGNMPDDVSETIQIETHIDNMGLNSYIVYPNPAENEIMISNITGIEKVELFDLVGKSMISVINNNSALIKIDVSNLKAGIYIIKLKLPEDD